MRDELLRCGECSQLLSWVQKCQQHGPERSKFTNGGLRGREDARRARQETDIDLAAGMLGLGIRSSESCCPASCKPRRRFLCLPPRAETARAALARVRKEPELEWSRARSGTVTKMAGVLYILRRHQRSAAGLCTLSMINVLLVLALSSPLLPHAASHPVDWLRKFNPSSRDDGSWLWSWAWASDGSVSVVDRSPAVTFPARPASFGAELSDPLLGYVIPLLSFTAPCPPGTSNSSHAFEADPVYGCPELCISGPHEPEPTDTWIALVQRGGCPFVEKARQAQRLGAKAVVVGGDRENPDALLNMFSESTSPLSFQPRPVSILHLQEMHLTSRSLRHTSSIGITSSCLL